MLPGTDWTTGNPNLKDSDHRSSFPVDPSSITRGRSRPGRYILTRYSNRSYSNRVYHHRAKMLPTTPQQPQQPPQPPAPAEVLAPHLIALVFLERGLREWGVGLGGGTLQLG